MNTFANAAKEILQNINFRTLLSWLQLIFLGMGTSPNKSNEIRIEPVLSTEFLTSMIFCLILSWLSSAGKYSVFLI